MICIRVQLKIFETALNNYAIFTVKNNISFSNMTVSSNTPFKSVSSFALQGQNSCFTNTLTM